MKRIVIGVGLLTIYAWLTWQRIPVWHNNQTLWTDAVRVTPCNPRAHFELSDVAEKRGETTLARQEYDLTAVSLLDPVCE